MTDDIVTRLRICTNEYGTGDVCAEAADEIERLRTELKRWDVCEGVFDQLCGWDTEETFCDKCKAVKSGL